MVEDFGAVRQPDSLDRLFRGWKAVVSAWAVVLGFAILLAGMHVLRPASEVTTAARSAVQVGAVIPRHDPVCTRGALTSVTPPELCRAAAASQAEEDDPVNPADW